MNMKIESPISVDRILFYIYDDKTEDLAFIDRFPYDERHDFIVDNHLGGIAVKVDVSNKRTDKGVRRNISFTLVDMTSRCEVAKQQMKVRLAKDDLQDGYVYFPAENVEIVGGHTYRLIVCDEITHERLSESVVHLLDKSTMGSPEEWYEVYYGGIRPAWEDKLYRSLNTVDGCRYFVQFNVMPSFETLLPPVLPELEIRLYYPEVSYVRRFFCEPFYSNRRDYNMARLTVEYSFETCDDIKGVFYAELRCMGRVLAGFVFDTERENDEPGVWFDSGITPMDEYCYTDAVALLARRLSTKTSSSGTGAEGETCDNRRTDRRNGDYRNT